MITKLILTIFTMLISMSAFAEFSETMKVIQVLKGDTVVAVNYNGTRSRIIHLAGVDCPENGAAGFNEAKNELSRLVLNQKVYISSTVDDGQHALGTISPGFGGSGKDIGSDLLQGGFCWYRNQESDQLRSALKASYKLLNDRARYKKQGIWKSGDIYFNPSPNSWRDLELYKLDQPRVNGADDPSKSGYSRPEVEKKDPTDWRTPIGNRTPSK